MKRKNDKRYFVVGLLAFMLVMVVGYALFAETLNISGTADATGTFDVEFTNATVSNETASTGATAVIDASKNLLTLTAGDLQKPGSTVTYQVTVTNQGNLPANLVSVNATGDTADTDIKITLPTWPTGVSLAASDTYVFDITVTWDGDSTQGSKSISYNIDLNYAQE